MRRVLARLQEPNFDDPQRFADWMLDILEAIEDEGSDRAIFVISADKSAWLGFEGTKDFWETVAARFEEATDDIANAMLCFGYEQNTACVFHLYAGA